MAYTGTPEEKASRREAWKRYALRHPDRIKEAKERSAEQRKKLQLDKPEVVRAWRRAFYARHKARLKVQRKAYFDGRKAVKAEYDRKRRQDPKQSALAKQRVKDWYDRHREEYNASQREKRRTNPQFAIANNLRGRMNTALRKLGLKRDAALEDLLGCTIGQLMAQLEAQFKDGMNWGNRGQWHIDHIVPCAAFDLTKPEQRATCFHHSNLQPLWASENIRKSSKTLKQAEIAYSTAVPNSFDE
jgi:hypothetical protein